MPIVETLQKIGRIFRHSFTSKPIVKNIDMGVFQSVPHDVTMVDGVKNLSKLNIGDKVIGFNVETNQKEEYQVTEIEMLDPEKHYYLFNGKYAMHANQSVMLGKDAVHAFRLRKGDMLTREDGSLEEITKIERIRSPYPFIKLTIDGTHTFYLNGILVHNASRYWVGGTAAWDVTPGTKWATTSGGGGGSTIPTTSDDAFFTNLSTGTCTITTGHTNCLSLDFTGFTGTFAGSAALSIAGSLTMAAGMTRTFTSALTFTSTSTGRTLTFAGKTMANNTTFNGVGGGWTVMSTWANTGGSLTLSAGALDTNGFAFTTTGSIISSGALTRSFTLGASTITCFGWNLFNSTGITVTANTSIIIMAGSGAGSFEGAGFTYNEVRIQVLTALMDTTNTSAITGNNTFAILRRTGAAYNGLRLAGNQTVTTTLELIGSNVNTQRTLIRSDIPGTQRTITCNGAITLTNVDFTDVLGAGSGSWTGTSVGDGGGNSGITFTAPVTRYWVGGTGNMTATSEYSTTSGGGTGASVPLLHDTLVIDANSFTGAGLIMSVGTPSFWRMPTLDFTNAANNPTLNINGAIEIYGSLIMKSGMSRTGTSAIRFAGRSASVLTSAGISFANPITQHTAPTAFLSLTDAHVNTSTFTQITGTFDANDQNITLLSFTSNSILAETRTIWGGAGSIWTLTGTGTVLNFSSSTALTYNCETSKIVVNNATATGKTLTLGSPAKAFYHILLTGAGTGTFTLSYATGTSVEILECDTPPHTIIFPATNILTINSASGWRIRGTAGNLMTIDSSSATNFVVSIASGTIVSDYLSVQDATAQGGAAFYAGSHSTDAGGGNLGWIFTAPAITFTEALPIVDTLTISSVFNKAFTEAVVLVDTIAANKIVVMLIDEAIALVDTVTKSSSRALSEAVALVDTVVRTTSRAITEAITVFDSVVKQAGKALGEAATIVDSVSRSFSRAIAEVATLVDTFDYSTAKILGLDEAIALVDTISRSLARAFDEVATLVDTVNKTMAFTLFNSITLVDTFVKTLALSLFNSITLVVTFGAYINGFVASAWSKIGRVSSTWGKTSRVTSVWGGVSRISSTWSKTSRISSAWDKVSRIASIWTKIDRQ